MTYKHRVIALENRVQPGPELLRFRAWLMALYRADTTAPPPEGLSNRAILAQLTSQAGGQDDPQT